ncbi:MAG: gliding motility-associated ABC transporter substrate-binding protein GldG [Bacteroidia bacterium]|nr:MAG: gliding motility-associated ABC transporter substrate-binding protein GldG [Bacteroidia bacterium]
MKKLLRPAVALLAIVIINLAAQSFYFRLDLTADRRYTLSTVTRQLLDTIPSPLYIKTYLGGDIPLDFSRLRLNLNELLEEYRVGAAYQIEVIEEDPHGGSKPQRQKELQASLMRQGIRPVNVQARDGQGGYTEKLVFPAITLAYRDRTLSVNLYQENVMRSVTQNVDQAIAELEYQLTAAIHDILLPQKPRAAMLHGHGELDAADVADFEQTLLRHALVSHLPAPTRIGDLDPFRFVIIANPQKAFREDEKLVLDQYLMQGGRILMMVNPVHTAVDSLQKAGQTLAYPLELNLEDQLFRYGLRVKNVLVQDMQCALVPINTALAGQPARFTPMPWIYFPLLTPAPHSLISRNLIPIYSRFPACIEPTGGADSLQKQVFLASSAHARVSPVPSIVSLSQIQQNPLDIPMPLQYLPVGVAVQGRFPSAFEHRPVRTISGGQDFRFRPRSQPTRLVLIADGRIAQNEQVRRNGTLQPLPLGFDKYTQQTFGNKALLENLSLYLLGQDQLLSLRGRTIKPRLLDMKNVHEQRTTIQLANILLPILLLLAVGGAWALTRRYRYGR